jgi:hypothetical protein
VPRRQTLSDSLCVAQLGQVSDDETVVGSREAAHSLLKLCFVPRDERDLASVVRGEKYIRPTAAA